MYIVRWHREDGDQGEQAFASKDEADRVARGVEGVALVIEGPVGSPSVFRHGRELQADEASDAVAKFGHQIEVGVSRPEEHDRNEDPDDSTGAGFRAGAPAVYGWRVWKGTAGPTPWEGTFATPEAAVAAAEEARERDPELAGLAIVRIDPASL